jgi:hypothetical protein
MAIPTDISCSVNPKGLAMLGFSGVFFAFVPVTS